MEAHDSDRMRDVFPSHLFDENHPWRPHASRVSLQSRLRKFCTVQWINDGIAVLNDLAGRGCLSQGVSNVSQRFALDQLAGAYFDFGRPPKTFCVEGSLSETLQNSHAYGDARGVAPFSEDSVSSPAPGSAPAPLEAGLSTEGRRMLLGWSKNLLRRPQAQAEARSFLGANHVFSDPFFDA